MKNEQAEVALPLIRRGRDQNLARLLVMLGVVFALMAVLRPEQFVTPANFGSMMRQFPEYGIMAIGVSLTMITGGIDLGVVGTANLSAILAAARASSSTKHSRAKIRHCLDRSPPAEREMQGCL